jgi:hypothetical protein
MAGGLHGGFGMAHPFTHQKPQQGPSARVVQAIPQGLHTGQGRWIQPQGDGLERQGRRIGEGF